MSKITLIAVSLSVLKRRSTMRSSCCIEADWLIAPIIELGIDKPKPFSYTTCNMKTAIISFSQLKSGRMDAGYNIAWQENKEKVKTLQKQFDKETLLKIAQTFPFDKKVCDRIAKGKSSYHNVTWLDTTSYDDLALYVAMVYRPQTLEQEIAQKQNEIKNLKEVGKLVAVALKA